MKEQPKPDWFTEMCKETWESYLNARQEKVREIVKKVINQHKKNTKLLIVRKDGNAHCISLFLAEKCEHIFTANVSHYFKIRLK